MKILDPTIDIPPITIDIDFEADDKIVEHASKFFGHFVPLLTFGENNILWSDILSFELEVSLYNLPTVRMVVDDSHFFIRTYLVDDLNIGLCRIGVENNRMQFWVLYNDINTGFGNKIELQGVLWNEKLWDTCGNVSYKDKTIQDILKEVCQFSECGLFTYPNVGIDTTIPLVINPGKSPLEFITENLQNRTINLWTWDPNYFLHVGDYDSIISQPTGQYTIHPYTGEKLDQPHDMIFYQNIGFAKEEEKQDVDIQDDPRRFYLPVKDYTPVSSYYTNSKFSYAYATEKDIIEPPQADVGIGMAMTNIFSGFDSHPTPFNDKIRQKSISKKIIKLRTDFIIPELNPFSVVDLKLYSNRTVSGSKNNEDDIQLDEANSGKKIVVGYNIKYKKQKKNDDSFRLFEEEIYCL